MKNVFIHFIFYQQLVNFVSDLGGSLGLWIGMSVLSFAEVVELLLLIGYALLRKLRTRLSGRIRSSSIPGRGTWPVIDSENNTYDAKTSSDIYQKKSVILGRAKSTEWNVSVCYSLILTFSHATVLKSLNLGKRFIWSRLLHTGCALALSSFSTPDPSLSRRPSSAKEKCSRVEKRTRETRNASLHTVLSWSVVKTSNDVSCFSTIHWTPQSQCSKSSSSGSNFI